MKVTSKRKVTGSSQWTIWEKDIENNNDAFSLQYLSMNNVTESVMILPLTKDNKIVFVNKFCAPGEKWELVLPGGKVENNLSPKSSAKKELLEETGYLSDSLEQIGSFKILPAYIDAKTTGFIASNLSNGPKNKIDQSEHLKIIKLNLDQALSKIKSGSISDSRTVAIILYYTTFVLD